MADRAGFPQIPRPVWYGVRTMFNKSLSRKLDENSLAASLDVQPSAARQYLVELKRVGLLTDDGAATDLAGKWRQDDLYAEATEEILRTAYPSSLVDLAPAGSADRAVVERWFKNQGLGEGTAKNKAATYLMIANGGIAFEPPVSSGESQRKPRLRAPKSNEGSKGSSADVGETKGAGKPAVAMDVMPLNVNVQIHISADASSDQIEAIFSAMRNYLHGDKSAQ